MVKNFDLGQISAGSYLSKEKAVYWDGKDALGEQVASGVYFYSLEAGEFHQTRKMIVLKERKTMLMTDIELEHRIKEILPVLAQKHELPAEISQPLMEDLTKFLTQPEPDVQVYEKQLQYVKDLFSTLKKRLNHSTYPIFFTLFQKEVSALAGKTRGLPEMRRYLTAAFAAAVRRSVINKILFTLEHVEALELVIKHLSQPAPTEEQLKECVHALEQSGLDTTIRLGESVKEFLQTIEMDEVEGRTF